MQPYIWVPATALLVYRAYSHQSLTPLGIVTAAITAIAHGIHPYPLPFVLLCVFFLAGTRVTKIKKDVKAGLTMQSTGDSGGEGPRTHIQVLANSGIATILSLIHTYQLTYLPSHQSLTCYPWGGSLLIIGIIANYAAVCADTFSSELGILSKSSPRLITSLTFRKVPPGTNGGITLWGTAAGFGGALVIVTASLLALPFCRTTMEKKLDSNIDNRWTAGPGWTLQDRQLLAFGMVLWGGLGSVLDSVLGGLFQASVVDKHTGKVVEGEGGKKVLIGKGGPSGMKLTKTSVVKSEIMDGDGKEAVADVKGDDADDSGRYDAERKMRKSSFGDGTPSRTVESGLGLLDNNEVNFLMAGIMTLGAMQIAALLWGTPVASSFRLR